MSIANLLDNSVDKPWCNIFVHNLSSSGIVQKNGQGQSLNFINDAQSISGEPFDVNPASMFNSILYKSVAGTLNMRLPLVTSIVSYLQSQGYVLVNGSSFQMTVVNGSAEAMNINVSLDPTHWFANQSTGAFPVVAIIPGNATRYFNIRLNNLLTATISG